MRKKPIEIFKELRDLILDIALERAKEGEMVDKRALFFEALEEFYHVARLCKASLIELSENLELPDTQELQQFIEDLFVLRTLEELESLKKKLRYIQ